MQNNDALVFDSQAEEIRFYTRQLLEDGKARKLKEIKEYIKDLTGKEFSPGAYAGALRDLIAKEKEYINPNHGEYQKTNRNSDLLEVISGILVEAHEKVISEVGKLNPIDLTEEEYKAVLKVQEVKKELIQLGEILK